ncbi:MAG: hypothetical protein CMI23_00975 [Opitutae bacterium]|nr:hypothetical protein [Opitutae bacterium]
MRTFVDWSKELWFALLFLCLGFTVWPLMVYYLLQYLEFSFFVNLSLRFWAEEVVYGPLSTFNFRLFASLLFLCTPYIIVNLIRLLLFLSRR